MKLNNIQVLFVISFILIFHRMFAEPSCTSFEYDKKILETMVRMEFDFKQMTEGIKITTQKVSDELVSLSEEKKKFIIEITETQERQALDLSKKISAIDAVFTNQQATIQRLAEDLHVLKNETVKDIIERSRHSEISFRASSSKNVIVSPGSNLVFPVVSVNHGNGYDPSTGRFTAPEKGTFMFIVQVCPRMQRNMVINIMVDGTVHMWALVYEADTHMCFSHSDVIDLDKGTEVWLQCGSGTSSSFNLYHDTPYRQNIFAGYSL